MPQAHILVIDDDELSQRALAHILGSEDWHVESVALPEDAVTRLAAGGWNLVVANVSMSSLSGPLFNLLRELAEAGGSLRVLFLVPMVAESRALAVLERLGLPYATKPLHLHDFLQQVTELLHQAGALPEELYRERTGPKPPEPRLRVRRRTQEGPQMFASREDYQYDYDEEELRRLEEEEEKKRKRKKKENE